MLQRANPYASSGGRAVRAARSERAQRLEVRPFLAALSQGHDNKWEREVAQTPLEEIEQQRRDASAAGNELLVLSLMEKALSLRAQSYGMRSPEISAFVEELVTMINTVAMARFALGDYELSQRLLKKADTLTDMKAIQDRSSRLQLRAVTLNNLGCFHRRRGKLHAALKFLEKALRIEQSLEELEDPASTHLNLCATLSELGRHEIAVQHAESALFHLLHKLDKEPDFDVAGLADDDADTGSVLAVAYYNLGVEQDFLGVTEPGLHSLSNATSLAHRFWGADHATSKAMLQRQGAVQAKVDAARVHEVEAKEAPQGTTQTFSGQRPASGGLTARAYGSSTGRGGKQRAKGSRPRPKRELRQQQERVDPNDLPFAERLLYSDQGEYLHTTQPTAAVGLTEAELKIVRAYKELQTVTAPGYYRQGGAGYTAEFEPADEIESATVDFGNTDFGDSGTLPKIDLNSSGSLLPSPLSRAIAVPSVVSQKLPEAPGASEPAVSPPSAPAVVHVAQPPAQPKADGAPRGGRGGRVIFGDEQAATQAVPPAETFSEPPPEPISEVIDESIRKSPAAADASAHSVPEDSFDDVESFAPMEHNTSPREGADDEWGDQEYEDLRAKLKLKRDELKARMESLEKRATDRKAEFARMENDPAALNASLKSTNADELTEAYTKLDTEDGAAQKIQAIQRGNKGRAKAEELATVREKERAEAAAKEQAAMEKLAAVQAEERAAAVAAEAKRSASEEALRQRHAEEKAQLEADAEAVARTVAEAEAAAAAAAANAEERRLMLEAADAVDKVAAKEEAQAELAAKQEAAAAEAAARRTEAAIAAQAAEAAQNYAAANQSLNQSTLSSIYDEEDIHFVPAVDVKPFAVSAKFNVTSDRMALPNAHETANIELMLEELENPDVNDLDERDPAAREFTAEQSDAQQALNKRIQSIEDTIARLQGKLSTTATMSAESEEGTRLGEILKSGPAVVSEESTAPLNAVKTAAEIATTPTTAADTSLQAEIDAAPLLSSSIQTPTPDPLSPEAEPEPEPEAPQSPGAVLEPVDSTVLVELADKVQTEDAAAVKIQAVIRGSSARKEPEEVVASPTAPGQGGAPAPSS